MCYIPKVYFAENLQMYYCYADEMNPEILNEFDKFIAEFKEYKSNLHFNGRRALMYFDLSHFIIYYSSRKNIVNINVNG